jgi:hypothetical protein
MYLEKKKTFLEDFYNDVVAVWICVNSKAWMRKWLKTWEIRQQPDITVKICQ